MSKWCELILNRGVDFRTIFIEAEKKRIDTWFPSLKSLGKRVASDKKLIDKF